MKNNLNYGVIGNCRTAALISEQGSIEWLCFPDFDLPLVFAALLDRTKGEFEVLDYMPCNRSFEKEHYLPAELYRYKGHPRFRIRYDPTLCAERGAHSLEYLIHIWLQFSRQQGPPVSLLFDSVASRRRPRGDPARKGRVPVAVVQREGHPDRHRMRKDRILPHAGLLAQLDQPNPVVHLLQRSHRTEHAGAEIALLL